MIERQGSIPHILKKLSFFNLRRRRSSNKVVSQPAESQFDNSIVGLEPSPDPIFVPWYKGNSSFFEGNMYEAMEWRQRNWGTTNFGVVLDQMLLKFKPSEVVAKLRDKNFDPKNIEDILQPRGVGAYWIENDEEEPFMRVVDGYIKNSRGWLSPVYAKVPWGLSRHFA